VGVDFEKVTGLHAAWLDLSRRGILRASGADRVRFLDGMLSNDVASLGAGESCYATLLDRKGHILADLYVLALEDEILLDTAPGTEEAVRASLERYVIADDVSLEDLSRGWRQCAFEGPGAASAAATASGLAPTAGRVERQERAGGAVLWCGGGSLTDEGVRCLGPATAVEGVVAAAGLPELPAGAAEVLRVEGFRPAYGIDMTDRNFPAEARLHRAISYTKGCYIGQEIVARIRSRGAVNRLLVKLRAEAPVGRGDAIRSGATAIGQVTSAVVSTVGGPTALGYVRAAHAAPGTPVQIGGVAATVIGPPLEEGEPP
jgi:folate-binding protein YgfZ